MIQAIETKYKGCRFRSRLEARWAVFFDVLDIEWEYEPEGFEVCAYDKFIGRYLPDFRLPKLGCWVEVKGSLEEVSDDYLASIAWCCDWECCLPGLAESCGTTRGLLWLGPIPEPSMSAQAHVILQHHKGGWANGCYFQSGSLEIPDEHESLFDASWGNSESLRGDIQKYYNGLCYPKQFCDKAYKAYAAARSARFEHGERPTW